MLEDPGDHSRARRSWHRAGPGGRKPQGIAARGETSQSLPAEPAAAPEPGKVCKRRSRGRHWGLFLPENRARHGAATVCWRWSRAHPSPLS